jgi:hypothetical protein
MADIVVGLQKLNATATDLGEFVFIFDTLKKMTDVINKREAKVLYTLLRSLSTKGATIILLGHTNKHLGLDGKTIFEGTGDLRADVDEMIYLDSVKDEATGKLTVTTRPDKIRADIKPISFEVDPARMTVTRLSGIRRIVPESEREIVIAIAKVLGAAPELQEAIVRKVKETKVAGEKKVRDTLKKYSVGEGRLFQREDEFDNNSHRYSLTQEGKRLA